MWDDGCNSKGKLKTTNSAKSGASDTSSVSGNTNEAEKCFANYHMKGLEYAIYDVCKSLAHGKAGFLLFDGRGIAERFEGMSKNTPYKYAKTLTDKGFFVVKKEPTRKSNGAKTSRHYDVLEHDEWAKLHP